MMTTETQAAIRTTYLSSIMQRQRNRYSVPGSDGIYVDVADEVLRTEAREFVLWLAFGDDNDQATARRLLLMWYVTEISADDLNAVMDAVDAEQGGEA